VAYALASNVLPAHGSIQIPYEIFRSAVFSSFNYLHVDQWFKRIRLTLDRVKKWLTTLSADLKNPLRNTAATAIHRGPHRAGQPT
jgi:hypothetical protein